MSGIIGLCGVGICAVLAAVILKEMKSGYANAIIIGFAVIVFAFMVLKAEDAVGFIIKAEQYSKSAYTGVIIKALCITYLTGISAEICRAAGEGKIGEYIETVGKIEIVALSVPLFYELLDMALI